MMMMMMGGSSNLRFLFYFFQFCVLPITSSVSQVSCLNKQINLGDIINDNRMGDDLLPDGT